MSPPLGVLDGVRWHGEPVPGDRGQALLAALVLAAPRAVPVHDLVDAVWPDAAPEHPEKALQVQVSRLRSRTSPEVVAHVGSGYRVGLRDDEVDALHLRRLVTSAREAQRAGDLDVARHCAGDALAVRVGTGAGDGPLADLVARADTDRQAAARLLGVVQLARGEHVAALPLLEQALALAPDDEPLLAQVLQAEAAVSGVPAALTRYAAYDARVRDRLGAEPGGGLRRVHAELLALDAPVRQGLKYDAAPMIGRDGDVAAIRSLLGTSRVVSIVGAGGLGKTRMAHLVGRLAPQPVVHFVELAGVTVPEGVLATVAGDLGVGDASTARRAVPMRSDLRSRLGEHLAGAPALLILDNCEHVVDAVADLVAYLVATVDGLSVLTTSRAPIGIAAEQVYQLPQLGRADAVELFSQRARAARSDVRLDPDEVAALTDRLDGLPLAVELAAAKVRVMSVVDIDRRLGDRFGLLVGRDRSAPDRHQTLEAVIAWSWNLLRHEDQQALASLSVFTDGFSLDGADAVLGRDAMASVAELVEQSLLVVREGERVRYRLLETVREYGRARLDDVPGAREEAERRLRDWAVGHARHALSRLYSPAQVEVMSELRPEAGNLAAQMQRAFDAEDGGAALPLVGALASMWTIEGEHPTVMELTPRAIEVLTGYDPAPDQWAEFRGILAALVVNEALFTGEASPSALDRLAAVGLAGDGSRSDALCRVLLAGWSLGGPGVRTFGDTGALLTLCEDPDPQVARLAMQWTSGAQENAGELEVALDLAERALLLCDDQDGPWTRALLHSQLSGLWTQRGDWQRARDHAEAALPVMRALGASPDVVQLRSVGALADLALGRIEQAAEVLDAIARGDGADQGLLWDVAGAAGQAELALARGEVDRGLQLYREYLETARTRTMGRATEMRVHVLPWVLFAQAAVLLAHVRLGRAEQVEYVVEELRVSLPRVVGGGAVFIDYPVLGGALLATGAAALTGPAPEPEVAAAATRLVALGHRFGYHQTLPSMSWAEVRALVDPVVGTALDDQVAAYAGTASVDLREEAAEAVRVVLG